MSHKHHDIFENRKEFQLERLILFSDAVFAIAITLLIIEIHVPELNHPSFGELANSILEKLPEFLGFLFSFVIIGQFWTNHHRMFGYITGYDNGLLWLNLHTLLWVVLMPFSTSFQFRYGYNDFSWIFYSCNLFMIGISMFFIWLYIGNPKRNLTYLVDSPHILKHAYVRSLTVSLIFLLGAILCFFNNYYLSLAARFVYFLIFPAMKILKKIYAKKETPH